MLLICRWVMCASVATASLFAPSAVLAQEAIWKAGAARVVITPSSSMWMSGYAARNRPAEGKLHDLWAKALVLQDAAGKQAVLVTLDLVGIDRQFSLRVRKRLMEKHQLQLADIALCSTHTHSGPVVGSNLRGMYALGEAQEKLIDAYTAELEENIVTLVADAFAKLQPAVVQTGSGRATFAVNRRANVEKDVPLLREKGEPLQGPVDHELPVLAVRDADHRLLAIVCGYACHATVLSGYEWSGDWPGFAQIAIEQANPGAVAMVWAGCGADQNPLPRREVVLAEKYGQELADGVQQVIDREMTPVDAKLSTAYEEIELALDELPSREQLLADSRSTDVYVARRAAVLVREWDQSGKIPAKYPYPVQAWTVGSQSWVLLGGEVVVDYSLRLKHELGPTTWISAYSNDVMAYIPSRRVLLEGGYEGTGAMVYYGLPGRWAPEVEEVIVGAVKRLAK